MCEVHSRDDASARKIATLREVFEEFQSTPINIDIKINNDDLIQKVCDEQRHSIEIGRHVWSNCVVQFVLLLCVESVVGTSNAHEECTSIVQQALSVCLYKIFTDVSNDIHMCVYMCV